MVLISFLPDAASHPKKACHPGQLLKLEGICRGHGPLTRARGTNSPPKLFGTCSLNVFDVLGTYSYQENVGRGMLVYLNMESLECQVGFRLLRDNLEVGPHSTPYPHSSCGVCLRGFTCYQSVFHPCPSLPPPLPLFSVRELC